MLSPTEIDAFVADGYVAVRGALPAGVLRACQDEIWSELSGRGEPHTAADTPARPRSWTRPACRSSSTSDSVRPARSPAAAESAATPREWPESQSERRSLRG